MAKGAKQAGSTPGAARPEAEAFFEGLINYVDAQAHEI
jgi:hypothetical protein